MGLYQEQVLPRLVHWGMNSEWFSRLRARTMARASGTVLEVGFGSGLNLPHYPSAIEKLWALEPSMTARRLAQKSVASAPFPVDWIGLTGEEIPLPSSSVDTVITTWTLCTIPDVEKALNEFLRVLKPGGHYLFVEHGLSPESRVQTWQHRLTPVQKRIAGGCHLDRPIQEMIAHAGFQITDIDKFYIKGPRPMTYMYLGEARKIEPG